MEWISVNDRKKPKQGKEVLVYVPECNVIGPILIGCYFKNNKSWIVYDFGESKLYAIVTHWMPLPKKP